MTFLKDFDSKIKKFNTDLKKNGEIIITNNANIKPYQENPKINKPDIIKCTN